MTGRERWGARLMAVVVVGAVAWPAVSPMVGGPDADSFPLSTYPMFTRDRGQVVDMATVVGVTHDGVRRLSPELIAGTDQVMLAATTAQRAVVGGVGEARLLCREVAERINDTDVAEVEVVVERYDLERWDGSPAPAPIHRRVVARCQVGS